MESVLASKVLEDKLRFKRKNIIECTILVMEILNLKGHQNCIITLKVKANLMKECVLPQ